KLEASHSAVRALSVSASNRGCMWHVSAPYRPYIGHRTGYSLHENARISGLASADFEGVFAHSYNPKLDAAHSAVRALSVSASNRGCMWHVSAPYRPCIGHRTGYSLHENARISGLASADFEGVFAHSYKRWRPRLSC